LLSNLPKAGTAFQASRGFMVERDSKETSWLNIPGKCHPAACTRYPVVASIATRECFNSDARNQANVSSDPRVARFKGSNGPTGLVHPGKSSIAPLRAVLLAYKVIRRSDVD
jgi:hypothetical protein